MLIYKKQSTHPKSLPTHSPITSHSLTNHLPLTHQSPPTQPPLTLTHTSSPPTQVVIGTGIHAEVRVIVAFGSLVLDRPLEHAHMAGEAISAYAPSTTSTTSGQPVKPKPPDTDDKAVSAAEHLAVQDQLASVKATNVKSAHEVARLTQLVHQLQEELQAAAEGHSTSLHSSTHKKHLDLVRGDQERLKEQFTHSLTHSPTHPPTHPLTHPLTHAPTPHLRLQEAASTTIGSMRSLLDEKNRLIEKYRARVEELQAQVHHKSVVDKRVDDVLRKLDGESKGQGTSTDHGDHLLIHKRLVDQIEMQEDVISGKDSQIQALEEKLMQQSNMRERAELRCGNTIEEMQAMKADMITLIEQLKDTQEKNPAHKSHDAVLGVSIYVLAQYLLSTSSVIAQY